MIGEVTGHALKARIQALGRERGFARVGVARAEPLLEEGRRLQAWLAAGYHGSMDYMERTAGVRIDPAHAGMLPEVRSLIVFAFAYPGAEPPGGAGSAKVARYARARDYHAFLYTRLRPITRLLREAGHAARAAVDSMPVFERAWAERAGVGFIGKNCCLIVPGLGSYVLLAAVVTSAELAPDPPARESVGLAPNLRDRCGECRLCLDACPTRAFAAARTLDARRCIAYLTIEHRGTVAPELRESIGQWVFGCDVCQEVCPYNRGAALSASAETDPSGRFVDRPARAWLELDEASFRAATEGTPQRRAGREGMARNAAVVLGNAKDRSALPLLRARSVHDPSPVVREAASWAIEKIERST